MRVNIVLLEPQIPQNTGNIARTCVITNSVLHIIGPIPFSLDEKAVKRAGLDYWQVLDIVYYNNYNEFVEKNPQALIYYATTKAKYKHSDIDYPKEDIFLMYGKETAGIPEEILRSNRDRCIRIPMLNIEKARSLNLSNSVAIGLYEILRQWDYPGMK